MPYCSNCGSKITGTMRFCAACGHQVSAASRPHEEDGPQAPQEAPEERSQQAGAINPSIKGSRLYQQWVKYAGLPRDEGGEKESVLHVKPADYQQTGWGEEKPHKDYRLIITLMVIIALLCCGVVFLLLKFLEQ